jgi:C-methyltransferase-like protein/putative zinc binding protein/methyltransferase family protein
MSKKTAGCRFCSAELRHSFVDLGMSPLCNTNVEPHQLNQMEPFYPLHALLCDQCFLVQLGEFVAPGDIFSDYSYFSSYADSWVQHAKCYAQMMVERHGINSKSMVMEIASNDGYLLQHFVAMQVPVLGIEPAANVAKVAVEKGIPTTVRFFGTDSAGEIVREHGQADLLLGNNVLAHVPKLNDFASGMKIALKPNGIITMEFPHLMRLMEGNQFDTIYHEHFSYFSFYTVQKVFAAHGITLFDVEELPTHGGSLRIFGCHSGERTASAQVKELTEREIAKGYTKLETYSAFTEKVKETKRKLLDFLVGAKGEGKSVAGYGAPGKGNTLLNYCGIREDFLDYTVDRSPHKQGRYTPGTRIPILHPDKIRETRPDYVLLLPWNLKDEIMQQLAYVRDWGGKFVTPIPEVTVYN